MGLLDSVLGSVLGGATGGAGSNNLMGAVVGLLGNDGPGGGLGSLLGAFQQGGLGHVIQSWISTQSNLPISPAQLGSVMQSDVVSQLMSKTGLGQGDLMSQLSQMLPQVVDTLTPDGQVPEGGLGNVADLLGRLLKN